MGLKGSSRKGQITCISTIVYNIAIMTDVFKNYTTLIVIVSVAGVLSTVSRRGGIGFFRGDPE